MPKVLQISHPKTQNWREWKTKCCPPKKQKKKNGKDEDHHRKFLKSSGFFVGKDYQLKKSCEIYFWGEWEFGSKTEVLDNNYWKTDEKIILNEPTWDKDVEQMNTDPLVFGENFYYSICKQKKIYDVSESGSIVLFGSIWKNKLNPEDEGFLLDTVLVVEKVIGKKSDAVPSILQKLTLDSFKCKDWYFEDEGFKIYQGKMFNAEEYQNNPYIFSFTPCKIGKDGENGFKQPILKVKDFEVYDYKLKNPGFNTYCGKIYAGNTKEFWDFLVEKIFELGYFLGVKINPPPK